MVSSKKKVMRKKDSKRRSARVSQSVNVSTFGNAQGHSVHHFEKGEGNEKEKERERERKREKERERREREDAFIVYVDSFTPRLC